jgi:hypothetical protein
MDGWIVAVGVGVLKVEVGGWSNDDFGLISMKNNITEKHNCSWFALYLILNSIVKELLFKAPV